MSNHLIVFVVWRTKQKQQRQERQQSKADVDLDHEQGDVEGHGDPAVRVEHGVRVRLQQGVEGDAEGRKGEVGSSSTWEVPLFWHLSIGCQVVAKVL